MHQHRSLCLAFLLCCLVGSARAASLNIIIFFADDLGYGDVGYQGGDLPTPHIDSIAHNGVQFTDGYVTCPVCAPSRAGLLTGRYQQRFGFADNPGPFQRVKTHATLEFPHLSQYFQNDFRPSGIAQASLAKRTTA